MEKIALEEALTSEQPKPQFKKKKIFIPLGIVLILGLFLTFFLYLPLKKLQQDGQLLAAEAQGIYLGLQTQNLKEAVVKIATTKEKYIQLEADYRKLVWTKFIPYFGSFYKDGRYLLNAGQYLLETADIAVAGLEPYADMLGFEAKSEEGESQAATTEERLMLALDTLDKIQPSLDQISEKLKQAQAEVDQIKPQRYPETIGGKKVREKVTLLIDLVDSSTRMIEEIKPIISFLKPMLGFPEERKYLLLFQNDAELRPTGGFLTAYAILSVKNGSFKPLGSYDIYTLDARFGNRLPAPEPIKKYHKNVYYWHLRDMNLSPDFKVFMETFYEYYRKAGGPEVQGVVAIDTKVLVDLLKILGPIGVADWGTFSAENDPRCNCPQVFYELELLADQPLGVVNQERKAMLGPLMHSILLNVMQSPRKKWPEFFNLAFTDIQEKHILFYFFEEELQKAMETLNAGGRIKDYEGDYLHLNDCNFAGAKSNMFIKVKVNQEIKTEANGEITKTLTIDYLNPEPPSNCNLEAGELCLNGLYRDWVRVYVPKGSELLEVNGSEVEARSYEELGKTVFEAFYGDKSPLRPQGKAQLVFKYKLPFKADSSQPYRLLIQKQPGTGGYEYSLNKDGSEQTFELKTDKELSF